MGCDTQRISAPQSEGTLMRVWMCLFMLWRLGLPALAQDRDYGRSMGVTGRGIVATSQVPASQAGAHILERGGSAIYYAEHGYSVPEIIPDFWGIGRPKLKQTEEAQRVFLPHGKPPAVGEPFSNPDLGKILRLLADDQGAREFYEGEIAKAILKTSTLSAGPCNRAKSLVGRFLPEGLVCAPSSMVYEY